MPEYSDCSSDASKYVLPWKIRRVKKHKLDRVLVNAESSSSSKYRHHHHHHPALFSAAGQPDDAVYRGHQGVTSADCCADSEDDFEDEKDEERQSASSESLDSVVERILENAASGTERHASSKRRRHAEHMATSGTDWREEKHEVDGLDRVHPSNEHRLAARNMLASGDRRTTSLNNQKNGRQDDDIRSADNGQQQQQRRTEKSLEDLFEEAVESLRDNVEYLTESAASPVQHRRLRSAENWEKQIYDSELHDQCRHYRLQTYTNRDTSRISRGFAVTQKLDKKQTPDLETSRNNVEQHTVNTEQSRSTSSRSGTLCRDDAGDVAYLQRTVITAKASSNDSRQPTIAVVEDGGVDLGLEVELAANERQRTSRSSSATWDSVSVDSLVMYDNDEEQATIHHAAALYSSSAAYTDERRQLDDEFVNKLRRLQDKWQQSRTNTGADDDVDAVWIPMSREENEHSQRDDVSCDTITNDNQNTQSTDVVDDTRQPETELTMTSLEVVDNAAILSDCVTSQQVVVNIRLPRCSRRRPRRSAPTCGKQCVPTVPFRELRLRREIRYTDDIEIPNCTSTFVTSSRDNNDVMNDRKSKLDDMDEALATTETSVVLTADCLLSGDDLSTLFGDAEVEYDNKDSTRSVELVPAYDSVGRPTSQRVDVSRSEATRVVRLPSTPSSQLVYSTPSLMETVDVIRRALLSGVPRARDDGVAVSCEAVETVTRRGDQSAPVVRNIVVDCLPPLHNHNLDDDDDDDSGNRTPVTS